MRSGNGDAEKGMELETIPTEVGRLCLGVAFKGCALGMSDQEMY